MYALPSFSSPRSESQVSDQENVSTTYLSGTPLSESQVSDQENVSTTYLSGTPLSETLAPSTTKQRKPPTITPRRFTRFFTPRSSASLFNGSRSKAARQLRDITKDGRNNSINSLPTLDNHAFYDLHVARPTKRRRRSYTIQMSSSPPHSSPIKSTSARVRLAYKSSSPWELDHFAADKDAENQADSGDEEPTGEQTEAGSVYAESEETTFASARDQTRVQRLRRGGSTFKILQRSFGGYASIQQGWRGADHCNGWREEVSAYVSSPKDCHTFHGSALPFCVTKCNTNSLIAIGQEEGGVRLIDSSNSADFSKPHVHFRPHRNAIIDLAFGSDDRLLATASGDQTARIIDMNTQQTACVLSGHTSSVKQIRWQPGTDNILTTSSRDGSIMVWDLRCGSKKATQSLRTHLSRTVHIDEPAEPLVRYATGTMRVGNAHRHVINAASIKSAKILNNEDTNISITAFQHLPNGREHLLVSASELNASLKIWDMRNAGRRQQAVPMSVTPLPADHYRTRNYGVNSIVLSGDGSRLYSLCRDATVYVYSTSHLVLGAPPELQLPPGRRRSANEPQQALSPIYALKHDQLLTGSFYIKATLRAAKGDRGEMLAVGSTDKCAILFPTDERYLTQISANSHDIEDSEQDGPIPLVTNRRSLSKTSSTTTDYSGSALVRGHTKEVTSLCWSHDGDLVTVGDDMKARCWREDRHAAAHLRTCGETGGRRWNHGWAEIDDEEYDECD